MTAIAAPQRARPVQIAPDSPPPPERIRVLVVDADPLARSAIAQMLRATGRFVVIATASDGVEGLELARHYRPDLMLIEAAQPRIDGVDLTRRATAEVPGMRVVVLTVSQSERLALGALQAGASGFLSKEDADPASVADALVAVHAGEVAIPGALARALVDRLRQIPEPGRGVRPIRGPLTSREWEVLDLLIAGVSTREIAERLVLTEDTVYSHVKNTMRKLGVRSRAEAVEAGKHLLEAARAA